MFGASSLTTAFTEIGKEFEAANAGVKVRFQFAGSPTLVRQITEGASADIFASADEQAMTELDTNTDVVIDPRTFAANKLTIIVEPGNPKKIKDLTDLARPDVTSVLCAIEVPCGSLGNEVLTRAGVAVAPRSYEENVKGVVAKVALGEVDAGLAYVSDLSASKGEIEGIPIAESDNATTSYRVALIRTTNNRNIAKKFVAFLLSPDGRHVLTRHGLLVP